MKTSAAAWKNVDSNCPTDFRFRYDTHNDCINPREWKRKAARFQKTKVKTNKTNKGFKS